MHHRETSYNNILDMNAKDLILMQPCHAKQLIDLNQYRNKLKPFVKEIQKGLNYYRPLIHKIQEYLTGSETLLTFEQLIKRHYSIGNKFTSTYDGSKRHWDYEWTFETYFFDHIEQELRDEANRFGIFQEEIDNDNRINSRRRENNKRSQNPILLIQTYPRHIYKYNWLLIICPYCTQCIPNFHPPLILCTYIKKHKRFQSLIYHSIPTVRIEQDDNHLYYPRPKYIPRSKCIHFVQAILKKKTRQKSD